MGDAMTESARIVRDFCNAMIERDAAALAPFLTEDAVYQNTGQPAVTGRAAILENLGGQFAAFPDSYEYRVINLVADDDVVLTERLDMIRTPTGELIGVPVMGTFVLQRGQIRRWTDYWDTALPMKMMTGEDISKLVPSSY
jgi:limonene-1,2-epoxide hydrolase